MSLDFSRKVIQFEGDPNAKILVISGVPSWEGTPLADHAKALICDSARRAGLNLTDLAFGCVLNTIPPGRKAHAAHDLYEQLGKFRESFSKQIHNQVQILIPLDPLALEATTGHKSIDDWQLSIIASFAGVKTIPIYHPERVYADYTLMPFFTLGWQRVKEELGFGPKIRASARVFHTQPTFEQAHSFLINKCLLANDLSIDIETCAGLISCVGFAPTPNEAMSIPTLPESYSVEDFHKLWSFIADVLAGPAKKVFQNFIYDCSYFSKYGMIVKNLWHDTMLAQKFIHPELPMGLDTIARMYTREPYWKGEGKDWKNPQNLHNFWLYNCKDAAVTLEAAYAQRKDLHSRGLESSFSSRVMALSRPAAEMCWRGLPVDLERHSRMRVGVDSDIASLNGRLANLTGSSADKPLNSRSPKQVKEFFKSRGWRLPVKKGKETSDVTALLKLQQKYPSDEVIPILLQLSEKNKLISSYLKPKPYSDNRYRFSFNIHGTDTGRWSCRKDPWDNGFNAQTISGELKKIFQAPPGWLFIECDLKQADSRFVAWDAPEPTLIKFFQENRDVHRFVASRPELFNQLESNITKDQRQLGKKVGHASNYGMRGSRLSEICLLEMGISLPAQRADEMLEGYHRVFPGIRMWQSRIESEIRRTKHLDTPLGRRRHFHGRLGDDLYRVAYAYRPQSTVSDVVNCLITFLDQERDPEKLHMTLQAHDAFIGLVREDYLETALHLIKSEDAWNPKIALAGGVLQIPVEIKVGQVWGEAKVIYG